MTLRTCCDCGRAFYAPALSAEFSCWTCEINKRAGAVVDSRPATAKGLNIVVFNHDELSRMLFVSWLARTGRINEGATPC